jgi:hypothetical protein
MSTPALVVFADNTDLWWLRLLKPGFRHCFIALDHPGGWIVIDPLSHHTRISLIPHAPRLNLADWYRRNGLEVVETETVEPARRVRPLRLFSCVETVKKILGLCTCGALTPWQLYRIISFNKKNIRCTAAHNQVHPDSSLPELRPPPTPLTRGWTPS